MPSKNFQPLPRHIREPIVYLLGGVIRELREKQGLTPAVRVISLISEPSELAWKSFT